MGVSTHTVEEAIQAEQLGASYITASHIFPTQCKPGLPPRGLNQVMTYVPGQGPCYRCIFEDVPEPGSVPFSSEVEVVGPVCGIIGCIQATEVLKYFTGAGSLLTGKILTFDALTMTSRIMKFPKSSPEYTPPSPYITFHLVIFFTH